jgi:hypothetical protein
MSRMPGLLLSSSLVLLVATAASAAQSPAGDAAEHMRTITALKRDAPAVARPFGVGSLDACTPKPLTPPATIQGTITSASCLDTVINSYEDIYSLNATAGTTVIIDYSSTAYNVFLWMEGVEIDVVSFLSENGVSRQRIVYTVPTTRSYKLEAETLYGPGDSSPHTGAYTLVVTSTNCAQTSTTMCLNDARFAVSAAWATNDGKSGQGTAIRLTSDTGFFTFFSATNVEAVVKVLNACTLNARYWVFAGGLTNVNVVLTVRDTKTGTVRTYTNPINTPYQPLQDTNAFATCP